jgi:hypothetical protein
MGRSNTASTDKFIPDVTLYSVCQADSVTSLNV